MTVLRMIVRSFYFPQCALCTDVYIIAHRRVQGDARYAMASTAVCAASLIFVFTFQWQKLSILSYFLSQTRKNFVVMLCYIYVLCFFEGSKKSYFEIYWQPLRKKSLRAYDVYMWSTSAKIVIYIGRATWG